MATDGHVSARAILRAVAELQREGIDRSMQRLEQTEPDLAEFLLEHVTLIHRNLMALGGPPKRTQRVYRQVLSLALTCVEALRRGHYELWQQGEAGEAITAADADRSPDSAGSNFNDQAPPPANA